MLNGRLFPVAEASSKKTAKKDAAAATLRVLVGEMQGGGSMGDEDSCNQAMDQLTDTSVSPSLDEWGCGCFWNEADAVHIPTYCR